MLDIAATGGWQAWALAFGVARLTHPGAAHRPAIVGCALTVLGAQRPDGSWPELVPADSGAEVQLTVLEELIRVIRIMPDRDELLRALRAGARRLADQLDEASPTSVIRACSIGLEVAAVAGDAPLRRVWHDRLHEQLGGLRGPLGGLEVRGAGPDQELERLRMFSHLAAVHAVEPNWIVVE
jgi:hypothetical protein